MAAACTFICVLAGLFSNNYSTRQNLNSQIAIHLYCAQVDWEIWLGNLVTNCSSSQQHCTNYAMGNIRTTGVKLWESCPYSLSGRRWEGAQGDWRRHAHAKQTNKIFFWCQSTIHLEWKMVLVKKLKVIWAVMAVWHLAFLIIRLPTLDFGPTPISMERGRGK